MNPLRPFKIAALGAALAVAGLATSPGQDIAAPPSGMPTQPKQIPGVGDMPLVVVQDNAEILAAPDKMAKKLANARYGDGYNVGETIEQSGRKFHLALKQPGFTPVGWFRDEDVLIEPRAARDERSGIYQKAVIVNKLEKTPSGKPELKGANSLAGPGKDAKGKDFEVIKNLSLFRFYYIFKKSGDGNFYLLGFRPSIGTPSTAKNDVLVGWVNKSAICEWNTREGVEFAKETLDKRAEAGGAKVFETERELSYTMRGETEIEGRAIEPIFAEDVKRKTGLLYSSQRFPLISSKQNDAAPKGGLLLEIGCIGDQITAGGATRSKEDLEKDLNKINSDMLPKLRAIDIVFVVDATGSMQRYFPAAAEAVGLITEKIEGKFDATTRPRIRYSVNFYRDYADETESYITKRLPFTENVAEVKSFFEKETTGGGGDAPESVFYGIDSALAAGGAEVDELSFKVLILVGDCGNHPTDARGYNVNDIAKRLNDAKYGFTYIQVVEPENVEKEQTYKDFRDQATAILNLLPETLTGGNTTTKVATSDPDKVAESLVSIAELRAQTMVKTIAATKDLTTGTSLKEIGSEYGVVVQQKLIDSMKTVGIDPNAYVEQSAQVFNLGWITENTREGVPQCQVMMLIEKATLEQLIGILAGFVSRPVTRQTVQEVWGNVLKSQIGEFEESKTVRELISNALGLPVKLGILNKTLQEIAALDDEQLAREIAELDKAKQVLAGIVSEKNLEIKEEKTPEGKSRYKTRDLGTRKVWWTNDEVTFYGWIKGEELP